MRIDEAVLMPSAVGFLVNIPSTWQVKCFLHACWVRLYVLAYLMVIALGFDKVQRERCEDVST
jgi:hypothetical protein